MAQLEFGIRRGLSQPIVRDNAAEQLQIYALQKQARVEHEAKAKLFADDFDYNNAINSYDNPKIKDYARKQLTEIGTFIRNNPDWETNPGKRIQYKGLVRNLKDNPDLMRGIQSDAAKREWDQWRVKNPDLANSEEGRAIEQQWKNYEKYGHQLGEQGLGKSGKPVPFMFIPPEAAVDTSGYLVDLAKNTQHDDYKNYQRGGFKQSVSNARKEFAVENAIANQKYGKYLKKDYEKYLEQFVGNDRTKAKTINQFTRERMEPYFQADKIDKGFAPEPLNGRGSGSGKENMSPSLWETMHKKAINTPGQKIDFGADAIQKTFGNAVGEMNLDGIRDPLGNVLNLGMRQAVATGLVQPHRNPDGSVYSEFEALARIPVEEFAALGNQYYKIIDEGGVTQGITPIRNSDNNWDIYPEYQAIGFKKVSDDKGRSFVQFPANQKYDPFNVHLADNYSNAHNIKQNSDNPYKGIADDGEQSQTQTYSSDGKWKWNGKEWVANK